MAKRFAGGLGKEPQHVALHDAIPHSAANGRLAGPMHRCIQLSGLMAVRGAQRLQKRLWISAIRESCRPRFAMSKVYADRPPCQKIRTAQPPVSLLT